MGWLLLWEPTRLLHGVVLAHSKWLRNVNHSRISNDYFLLRLVAAISFACLNFPDHILQKRSATTDTSQKEMPTTSANRSKGMYWERPIKQSINQSINQSIDRLTECSNSTKIKCTHNHFPFLLIPYASHIWTSILVSNYKSIHTMPSKTLPKTTCRPSSHEVWTVVRKNWLPLVSLPAFAMESQPAP